MGALIRAQARREGAAAQFIISTFNSEILDFGDRFFGVSMPQKNTSAVEEMAKDEAAAFVQAILDEERAKAAAGARGAAPAK